MKSILSSIRPEWVAMILNGIKKIEVRNTAPKDWKDYLSGKTKEMPKPIDVYIYCTKGKDYLTKGKSGKVYPSCCISNGIQDWHLNGKVVAKFTLNKVEEIYSIKDPNWPPFEVCDEYVHVTSSLNNKQLIEKSCLDDDELFDYLEEDEKVGYAWYIDNLVIFDEPKELSEFWVRRNSYGFADNKAKETYKDTLIKAPQSWQFIETEESL